VLVPISKKPLVELPNFVFEKSEAMTGNIGTGGTDCEIVC